MTVHMYDRWSKYEDVGEEEKRVPRCKPLEELKELKEKPWKSGRLRAPRPAISQSNSSSIVTPRPHYNGYLPYTVILTALDPPQKLPL